MPPGWYPDPWQQAAQRFWDGNQWTHRISGGAARIDRPRVAADAPIYGWLIWVIVLLPLLSAITIWFVHVDFAPLVTFTQEVQEAQQLGAPTPQPDFNVVTLFGVGYLVNGLLGFAAYVASVVLAYFDHQRLVRIGVIRPFFWAWAFLAPAVYVIGRSVIVRRVAAPRGLTPIWVLIGAFVVTMTSAMVWSIVLLEQLGPQLGQLSQTVPS